MGGGDLFQYLKDLPMGPDQAQRLGEEDARGVFHQVISAVGYAHNHHICHRDLKLDNILLIDDDSGSAILSHIKVADFGLSEFYRPGEVQNSQCGTLSYLAPEVFRGMPGIDPCCATPRHAIYRRVPTHSPIHHPTDPPTHQPNHCS